ncbi:SseB family protein [Auritidibacter ignavus]|uniref:SseB family protein n=1 Tax=Auritidibacter ignavus TaxID=678932 RepID=UPI0021040C69|nr:SseB family protein [Auritidibacter ignavus]
MTAAGRDNVTGSGDRHQRSTSRQLPAHIQAAIQRNLAHQHRDAQRRPADSAGIAWKGRDLSGAGIDGSQNPLHAFDTDDGTTDQAWTTIAEQLMAREATEIDAIKALAKMRVFAAVVPTATEVSQHDDATYGDKAADVALVSLQAKDGRQALPVFTSVPALTSWNPQARPVAVWMPRACLAAVDEGDQLVVVDPGDDLTFVVRRPAVWALAQQRDWVPSYVDEQLSEHLADFVGLVPGLARIEMLPGPGVGSLTRSGTPVAGGGAGPELELRLVAEQSVDSIGQKLMLTTFETLIADDPMLAERADSVELRLVGHHH